MYVPPRLITHKKCGGFLIYSAAKYICTKHNWFSYINYCYECKVEGGDIRGEES